MQHLRIVSLLLFAMVVFGGVKTAMADVLYSFTTIDVPGALLTFATGINDGGQIVGIFQDALGNDHGFLDSGGSFTTIDVPGAIPGTTFVSGINDSGQIVGSFTSAPGALSHGFLYSGGSFSTIDVPGAIPGTTSVSGINDSGQIVGHTIVSGQGFVATPIPEPSTLPILAGCLVGFAIALRRKSAPGLRKKGRSPNHFHNL